MQQSIELLCIRNEERQVAIDVDEVLRVTTDTALIRHLMEESSPGDDFRFYRLETMFQAGTEQVSTLIFLDPPTLSTQLILGITGEIEMLHVNLADILLLPKYLRSRQTPFVTWGYVKKAGQLMMLLSFSHITEEFL